MSLLQLLILTNATSPSIVFSFVDVNHGNAKKSNHYSNHDVWQPRRLATTKKDKAC
jgi:hypothetical protein